MKKEIADKWTAALRSGDYKQGPGALCKDGAFCCLGVLCDLHRKEVGGEWTEADVPFSDLPAPAPFGSMYYTVGDDDYDYALLPETVAEWAGVRSISPSPRYQQCLTVLNDNGWKFEHIADLIDTNWEDL